MKLVGPGTWRPLYPAEGEEEVFVDAFLLDEHPVTNADFAAFLERSPSWRPDRVAELFAGPGYLTQFADMTGSAAQRPVTYVSWWAARAYCADRGAHLPTERQWELAAMASEEAPDATSDPAFLKRILSWYAQPSRDELRAVGGPANYWGVRDLHGLVWEWVDDFQSALVSVDNRDDGAVDTAQFCGAGAVSAATKQDYAAFMRIAFRASLHANFALKNLGFRCAQPVHTGPPR